MNKTEFRAKIRLINLSTDILTKMDLTTIDRKVAIKLAEIKNIYSQVESKLCARSQPQSKLAPKT